MMDKFVWLDGRSCFTMKATYRLIKNWGVGDAWSWEGWKWIWKARIQQRVRISLWLLAHGRILTNADRWRKVHFTSNVLWARCLSEEEGEMHALRDCYRAKDVWNLLISAEDATHFYGLECRDCILWMLRVGAKGRRSPRWPGSMIAVCWLQ